LADLKFPQQSCRGFWSSGMWPCVVALVSPPKFQRNIQQQPRVQCRVSEDTNPMNYLPNQNIKIYKKKYRLTYSYLLYNLIDCCNPALMIINSKWTCLFVASFDIRVKIIFDIKISSAVNQVQCNQNYYNTWDLLRFGRPCIIV
jgi:hypothetical protein